MNQYYPESSDQYSPNPQGKLVLPAYQDTMVPSSQDAQTTYIAPMGQSPSSPYDAPGRSELLMQHYASSSNISGKLRPRSRANPAQLILVIAIIVVLIATGSVAAAAATLFGPTATKTGSTSGNAQSSGSAAQARATTLPTITSVPSPTLAPTAAPTLDGGPLTLTLGDLPQEVANGDSGNVTVQTNQPGISVHLEVTYAAPPYKYFSDTEVTDANGMATLTWNVQIFPSKRRTNAQVVAVTQEQNGRRVESDPVTVKIIR